MCGWGGREGAEKQMVARARTGMAFFTTPRGLETEAFSSPREVLRTEAEHTKRHLFYKGRWLILLLAAG